MNPEILNNIYNHLKSNGLTDSDFNSWQTNFNSNSQVRTNIHNYLKQNKLTDSDYNQWESNIYGGAPKQQPIISSFQDPNRLSKDRGYRNNNPLNLKDKRTKEFRVFNTLEEGYQAAEKDLSYKLSGKSPQLNKTLREQGKSWGEATLKDLIYTWAPPSDNSKESLNTYLKVVQQELGVDPNTTHPSQVDVKALTIAMSKMESGHSYDAMLKANRAPKNEGTPSPANKLSPVTADLEKEATFLAEKKIKDQYSKMGFLDKLSTSINRKGFTGIFSDMYSAITEGDASKMDIRSATASEIEGVKRELLNTDKYRNLWQTKEDVDRLLKGDNYKSVDEHLKIADNLQKEHQADVAEDWGILDGLSGHHYKTENGKELVNLKPFGGGLKGTVEDVWVSVDDVKNMTTHPSIDGSKTTVQKRWLNEKLNAVQADLAKKERYIAENVVKKDNNFIYVLEKSLKGLEKQLESKYPKGPDGKMTVDPNDPLYARYQKEAAQYNQTIEDLKTYEPDMKVAALFDNNKKARINALDKDTKNLNLHESIGNELLYRVNQIGTKLYNLPRSTGQAVGGLIDATLDTNISGDSQISDAWNDNTLKSTGSSRAIRKTFELPDGRKLEYSANGDLVGLLDNNDYTLEVSKEELLSLSKKHNADYSKASADVNWSGVVSGMGDLITDLPTMMVGSGGIAKALGAVGKSAVASRYAGVGRLANGLANSDRIRSFTGAYSAFYDQITEGAIKEGGLTSGREIGVVGHLKTTLEGTIEAANPIEGKILSGKIWDSLSTAQVKQFTKRALDGESTSKIIEEMVDVAKSSFTASKLKNYGSSLVDTGVQGIAEGLEEVAAAILEPELVNKVLNNWLDTTYNTTANLEEISEGALVGFAGGFLLGGVGNLGSTITSNSKDAILNNSIRASLQHSDVFKSTVSDLFESKKAQVTEQYKNNPDELNKNLEILQKGYDKVVKIHDDASAIVNDRSVFRESSADSFIPSKEMQTAYSDLAFKKGFLNSIDVNEIAGLDVFSKNVDKQLQNLDLFKKYRYNGHVNISNINDKLGKDDKLDNKLFDELYPTIMETVETEIKALSKSNMNEASKLDIIGSKTALEISKLKNGTASEVLQNKYNESKKRIQKEEEDLKKAQEELAEKQMLNDSYKDYLSDRNLTSKQIAEKHKITQEKAEELLSKVKDKHTIIKNDAYKKIYNDKIKKLTNNPDILTEDDIQFIINGVDINTNVNLNGADVQEINDLIASKINDPNDPKMVEAMKSVREGAGENFFKKAIETDPMSAQSIGIGKHTLSRVPGQNEFRVLNPGKDYGKVASRNNQILATASFLDSVTSRNSSPVFATAYRGLYQYDFDSNSWIKHISHPVLGHATEQVTPSPKAEKQLKNKISKNFDELYEQGLIDFTGDEFIAALEEIQGVKPKPIVNPTKKNKNKKTEKEEEEAKIEYIQDKLNDSLTDASLDPNLEENKNYNTKRTLDFIIKSINTNSILYDEYKNDPVVIEIKEIMKGLDQEVVDHNPIDQIFSIITDINKNSEFINTIYNFVKKSQDNAEAKFNWTNGIAKNNGINSKLNLKEWLSDNVDVNYDIDLDYIRINFNSDDVTIANNKLVKFDQTRIGELPINLIYTDKTTGIKYFSFMHDSSYFNQTSRFDDQANAVSAASLDEYLKTKRSFISSLGIPQTLFDNYILENQLDKFPSALLDEINLFINTYYIKTHSGKNIINITPEDFENVINNLKEEIYKNKDNINTLKSKVIDLSTGHFEFYADDTTTKTSELSSEQGNTIHSIEIIKKGNDSRGTPGSVIANIVAPNLTLNHIYLTTDEYTDDEIQALKNLLKSFLEADSDQREQIRRLSKLFIYDNEKGDNSIRLVVDANGNKPFIKVKVKGKEAELNTNPKNSMNEKIDAILDSYFKHNPNKFISDIYLNKEKEAWKDDFPKLMLDDKVIFSTENYKSYEDYVKTITNSNAVSLDIYQSNIKYRATPENVSAPSANTGATTSATTKPVITAENILDDIDDILNNTNYSATTIGNSKIVDDNIIKGDVEWLNIVLPQLGVPKHVVENITSDVEVLASFVSSLEVLDDFGKNYGIYYSNKTKLNSNRSQIRHEAFEAIYALYLTDPEKKSLLDAAKKRFNAPAKKDLDLLSKLHPNLSKTELIDKWYKEELADTFNEYEYVEPKNIIEKIFNKLKDLINNVLGRRDVINSLFNNINSGKYKNKPINKKFIKNMTEYSSVSNKNVTDETARKIGKSLATLMLTQIDNETGRYAFIDMDNVTYNNIPIIKEKAYNSEEVLKVYGGQVRKYLKELKDTSKYNMTKDLFGLHVIDFRSDKLIYNATIAEFNKILKIKTNPESEIEDFYNENEEESESRDGKQFNISTAETDYKSNQYPVIKLLFSSIMDPKGTIIGADAPISQNVPYEVINNLLVLLFSDKYAGSGDIDNMIEDIKDFIQYRQEFEQIYMKLSDWKDKGYTHLLNQFANSVIYEKFNFINVIKEDKTVTTSSEYETQYDSGETTETTTSSIVQQISKDPVDTLEDRWERIISNLFVKYDTSKTPIVQTVNKKEGVQKLEILKNKINNNSKFSLAFKSSTEDMYISIGLGLREIFKELGINFNMKAAKIYFKNHGTQDPNRDLAVIIESLNLLVEDKTKTDDILKRDLMSFVDPSRNKKFEDDYGELKFKINENVIRNLIKSQLIFEDQILENTILSGSVRKWIYGLPSFLNQQLLQLQNNKDELFKLSNRIYHKRSLLLNAMKDGFKPALSDLDNLSIGIEDINLAEPRLVEDLYASIQVTLSTNNRAANTPANVRLLSFNSHKRNNVFISIPEFYSFRTNKSAINNKTVNLFRDYFLDEYERILMAINSDNNSFRAFKNLNVNSYTSNLFPELSYNYKGKVSKEIKQLRDSLYSKSNLDVDNNAFIKNTNIKDALGEYIENKLIEVVESQKQKFLDITNNNLELLFPGNLLAKYETSTEKAINNAIADFVIMGMIGSIEHTKVFIGDPAQYKGLVDLSKRTHSTTSSGMQYMLPFDTNYAVIKTSKKSSEHYNDKYQTEILFDVRKREWETYKNNGDIKKIPSDEYIQNEIMYIYKDVKKLNADGDPESRAYGNIDDTDGFAEVTLPMWREMLNSIGRWNSAIHDPIYEKLLKGEAVSDETTQMSNAKKGVTEILSSLQPIKSVQFGTSLLNNEFLAMSTYHKWALVPSHPGALIAGSERQKRYNLAVYGKINVDYKTDTPLELSKQTHFYLYDSATKSTYNTSKQVPSSISDDADANTVWNNNVQQIPSWTMKLQNDLSAKFYKKAKVQEGSQFRKNVFQNIQLNENYSIPESTESKTGKQLLSEMQDIDSTISNRKLNKFIKDVDYDSKNGVIGNKKQFTNFILGELERRTPTDNLLNYLKNNEFNINLVPQFKSLFENIYSSINRNRIIKSEVTGGSFIEIPETGLTGASLANASTNINDLNTGNIILLNGFTVNKNGKLKGPTLEKNVETNEIKYSPSLVFLPHQLLKSIPEHKRTSEYLNQLFKDNPKLLRGLGYRIPNQGASSMDSFEIAGILPEYMGDSIIVYQDITTKYGSDYDIDKMYVSLYNFKFDNNKLTTIPYYSNPTEEENNQLYEARISELLKDNAEYKKILYDIRKENNEAASLVDNLDVNKELAEDISLKNAIIDDIYNYLNDNSDDDSLSDSLFSTYINTDDLKALKSKVDELIHDKKKIISDIRSNFPIDKFNKLSVYDKHSEKALQNRKMDIYRSIIESELFHFENIAPLDKWVEPIKDSINELYNIKEGDNNNPVNYSDNLEFFTTFDQLLIKNINNNAKKALAIAANSGVALPFQRQAEMKYFINIGKNKSAIDFTEIFDIENKLKSQRISAGYLSAFVDADKDPYIIFANINTFTYPIVDTLIRAGATERQIITFMSQPVIKEILFSQNLESPLFPNSEKLLTSIEKVANKYTSLLDTGVSFNITGENNFSDLFDKYIWDAVPGSKLNTKLKNNVYAVNVENKENILTPLENLEILYLFNQLKLHSSIIANSITSSKYTVSGGGATFNESLVKYEATRKSLGVPLDLMGQFVENLKNNTVTDELINDINSYSPIYNYVKLFVKKTEDGYRPTSEGTYFLNSAVLLKDFSSGDNITQHPFVMKSIYDIHALLGKPYITDPKVVNKIKNNAYTFLINRSLMSKPLEINGKQYNITPGLIENLFKIGSSNKDASTFLTRIFNDDFREIAPTLVDVLIPKKIFKSNKSLSFVRSDNFKTSDISIKNQIIKEVEAVIENDRKRNTNPSTKKEARNDSLALLLYSFYSSGFTFDSSSFFDLLPLELTEKLINVSHLYEQLEDFNSEFITQFIKSNYHDRDFVQILTKNPYNSNMGGAVVYEGGRFITGYNNVGEYTYKPFISFYNKERRDHDLYSFYGKYTVKDRGKDTVKLLYKPISKLGYKAGRFKITELGTNSESWLNPEIKGSMKNAPKSLISIDNQPVQEYIKDINKIDVNSIPESAVKTVPLRKNKEVETMEFTPETITSLKPNEIFVFGSNEGSSKGGPQTHGKGAALDAKKYFGAVQGQARGLQGQSYAVVTKKYWDVEKSSTLDEIYEELSTMLTFAKSNPDKRFLVTKVGSSLAGYTVDQIKELFEKLNTVQGISDNVILPKEYEVRSKDNLNAPDGLPPIDRSPKKCKTKK